MPSLSDRLKALGVELGGAVKNVLAIACGIVEGLGLVFFVNDLLELDPDGEGVNIFLQLNPIPVAGPGIAVRSPPLQQAPLPAAPAHRAR